MKSRQYRDESARTGVQLEACDQHLGSQTVDRGDTGLERPVSSSQNARTQRPTQVLRRDCAEGAQRINITRVEKSWLDGSENALSFR